MSSRKSLGRGAAIFLTGVTGFLGGAFLAQLLESPFEDEVVCLVRADDDDSARERVRRSVGRFAEAFRSGLPKRVRVLRGDLLSDEWHKAPALEGVTHVLHLAANTSFGNNHGISRTNVDGSLSVAKAMEGRPIERYLHTSTATICGANPPKLVHEDDYPSGSVTHLVDYTRTKAEAEKLLAERHADLPVVVVRPSIVVGHTRLGCKPSGSIFWVLRAVEAMRWITWNPANHIDVVPVDWAAAALAHLLLAPRLSYSRYHVSAGKVSAVRWQEIESGYASIAGGPAQDRYEVGPMDGLTLRRVKQAAGSGHARHLLQALRLYHRFCSLDLTFDNGRLLEEGMSAPPRFTGYMRVCLETSAVSIYDQMRIDMDPALVLV